MAPLHEVREVELHVVAQVVEAELVVRAVGDVAGVGGLALGVVHVVLDDADGHAEEAVDAPHPLRVAPRQVVVDRHDVHALALEGVQVGGQRRDERLPLAGLHLGDLAAVQHDAADELDVEVAHVQRAARRLAHDGEGLRQQIVERLAARHTLAEARRLRAKLLVAERAHRRLELVDARHDRLHPLQLALVLGADDLGEDGLQHEQPGVRPCIRRLYARRERGANALGRGAGPPRVSAASPAAAAG